ncbi:MAG: IS3 family transposase [Acidobacteria bacterium]|nr:IS3 family transposase [Acidobacteriota bacterium]
MRDHRKEFRLTAMCRALEVSAAGYYAWRARQPSQREKENERLVERIKAAHAESRGQYGSPKVDRKLRRDGERVSRKRVARLRQEHGITARRVKQYKQTTDSRHNLPVAENILARNFKTTHPDAVWTRGHHLRLDCAGLALPRRLPRSLFAARRWVGGIREP